MWLHLLARNRLLDSALHDTGGCQSAPAAAGRGTYLCRPMNLPLIQSLRELALDAGLPGVLGLSFLDSAGIPTGGGPDVAVVILSGLQPEFLRVALFVLAATFGSTAGCTALYFFGRKGGELALRRFDGEYRERVKDQIRRNGFGAIFIATWAHRRFRPSCSSFQPAYSACR